MGEVKTYTVKIDTKDAKKEIEKMGKSIDKMNSKLKGESKHWLLSRLMFVGYLQIAHAVFEAINNGLGWKEVAMAGIGVAIVVLRPLTTKKLTK